MNLIAGRLRAKLGRPVSVDETMEFAMKHGRLKPGDFAGKLSLSDEEEARISESLEEFWSRWKFPRR